MDYYEYIEKILWKADKSSSDYTIFVEIPIEDIMNKKIMKEIFGDRKKHLERIKRFKQCLLYDKYLKKNSKCTLYISRIKYSFLNLYIKFHILYTDYNGFNFQYRYKLDDEEYIYIIKKIGNYYPWEDNEENLTDNIEKKQLTLYSLLYNSMNF